MCTYHLISRYKLFYSFLLVVSCILLIVFFYIYKDILCFSLACVAILIFGVVRTIHRIVTGSLTVSENGIVYRTLGITIETSWKYIEAIQKVFDWYSWTRQDCLIVDQSNVKVTSSSSFGMYAAPPVKGLNLQKAIFPLSCFSDDWRDSELGQKIKQYAPHLNF